MSNYSKILDNKKKIIKALLAGVSIKRICERLKVDRVSFYKAMREDDDFKIAIEHHHMFVENMFL